MYIVEYLSKKDLSLIMFEYNTGCSWLYYSLILFILSLHGIFLGRRNIIVVLMSIELLLISIMLIFILFSLTLDDLMGQVSTLFILTVGASESAVGLSLIVSYYKSYNWHLEN